MDELKSTISILGDEISDFRDRADNILSDVYEKIEEQAEYIEDLENCLINLVYGFSVEEIEETCGIRNSDARHIHALVGAIHEEQEKKWAREEEAERRANMTEEERAAEYEKGQAFIESAVNDLMASDIEWSDHNDILEVFTCHHVAEIRTRTGCSTFQAETIAAKIWHRLRSK